MEKLKHHLPPLTSLVAFEAVARTGSYKAGAQELNVTREAVSRQVRALEAHLGMTLFDRDANSATLSPSGQRFFETVSPNLWAIADAARELSGPPAEEAFTARDAASPASFTEDEQSRTILIIDDHAPNIRHLSALIGGRHRVLALTDGTEVLSFLGREAVDLILLDVVMPGLDGFDLCQRIKSTASLASIPIIFITNLDTPEDEIRGLSAGAADFITRPIVPAVLEARIRLQLDLLQARSDLETLLRRRADRLDRLETALAAISAEITRTQRV
ncbi:response regulator [Arenibacterium sp. LLYu02]|uniref:response regulator n=1 Tax=Arenibacterium sp. LLYu02 TaxID=3404132 RepID=UPI003B214480